MKKNILLTGCSRGVGLETAKLLIKKGYNVYGVSRKLTIEYQELLTAYPKQVFFKSYDLANVVDIQKDLFKNFISNSIPLHGFVNNAAIAYDDIITNFEKHDAFADAQGSGGVQYEKVHIRIQKRNQRKSIVTITGLAEDLDLKKICRAMKKRFSCNGAVVVDKEHGDVFKSRETTVNQLSNF